MWVAIMREVRDHKNKVLKNGLCDFGLVQLKCWAWITNMNKNNCFLTQIGA